MLTFTQLYTANNTVCVRKKSLFQNKYIFKLNFFITVSVTGIAPRTNIAVDPAAPKGRLILQNNEDKLAKCFGVEPQL